MPFVDSWTFGIANAFSPGQMMAMAAWSLRQKPPCTCSGHHRSTRGFGGTRSSSASYDAGVMTIDLGTGSRIVVAAGSSRIGSRRSRWWYAIASLRASSSIASCRWMTIVASASSDVVEILELYPGGRTCDPRTRLIGTDLDDRGGDRLLEDVQAEVRAD